MISIISINQTPNTAIITEKVVRIAEESDEKQRETNYNNNNNSKNIVNVKNCCKTVPVINDNGKSKQDHPNRVNHENVHAQSISHDEFDVDEGFNEDSSSSITSGNNSIVSTLSSSATTSSSSSVPSLRTPPDLKDLKKLLTISGPNGSVRGKRNSVRNRIQNYKDLIKLAVILNFNLLFNLIIRVIKHYYSGNFTFCL